MKKANKDVVSASEFYAKIYKEVPHTMTEYMAFTEAYAQYVINNSVLQSKVVLPKLDVTMFETWAASQRMSTEKNLSGNYAFTQTMGAYAGWQAAQGLIQRLVRKMKEAEATHE